MFTNERCALRYNVTMGRSDDVKRLVWEWDPLGDDDPIDPHLPSDEYDWLIRGVEAELAKGTDAYRLAAYMAEAVRCRYGLNDAPPVEGVAERIAALGP